MTRPPRPAHQGPWVKLEKSLYLDARIHRIARELAARDRGRVTGGTQTPIDHNAFVAMAIGAVSILWITCEQAVDDFDRTPFTPDDVDQFTGIKGICDLLPPEWLQVVDGQVTLPNFHNHNGTLAKRRAVDADRKRTTRADAVRTQCGHIADKMRTRTRTKNKS